MAPTHTSLRTTAAENIVLIPAINKNSTTGYKGVTYDRSRKKFVAQVWDGGKHVHLGYFATAEGAAIAYALSEYGRADAAKLLQPRAAPTAAGAEEEALECVICLDDLSAHAEARLQPRDPNGWGATRCCKSLFHYRCLHTWLSDDSEVETSRGMEPINTACPGCRGFVSKSASRMLC
ncbi:hypothetical protein EMIHUDRAFT_223301 [Emiliania huxleyi CCMP1516]|uniref:RING-type domain-containing protein n=2 Tax=Emiliania huxleyi TaxID=2903 RepID=A0A0D3KVJ2_EMIH1|nr:hypothetical protein EMIHUDRAFT_223301 [Emiliania huxleyi CCMP1516]EOD39777.1 hypothetical protein EMIHUDRAFT_223301 [Emiliania huxleyi CCMP1516]|eukprot:XP_005792206.1 hypothetical protein EMIHUDRAFT_223301 [Emiliania huxleyi CCMP1516]